MGWFGRVINLFRGKKNEKRRVEIDANLYRPASKKEQGFLGGLRRYVLKSAKLIRKGSPSISVRQYQQAQHGVTLEKRAKLYKSGEKTKRTYQSRTKYPRKLSKSRLRYEDIPWSDVPKYYQRVKRYHIQVLALGQTKQTYNDGGSQWRTIGVFDGDELPALVERVESERGFGGFNIDNTPELVSIHVWKISPFRQRENEGKT